MKDRLSGIQALRGVAALAVVCRHALTEAGITGWPSLLGAAGVDVFFVISGFVMAYTSDGQSARNFLLRRIARVVPLYWLATLALVAIAASGVAYQGQDISVARILQSLAFVAADPVIFVGWSLNYEMFFYLLYAAMIALGLQRWSVAVIALCMLASIASGAPGISRPIVLEFAFGVGLGVAHLKGLTGRFAVPAAVLASALFVATSMAGAQMPGAALPETIRWLWWGAPSLLAVYAALWWKPRFTLVGDASYSIYLVHVVVMTVLAKVLETGSVAVWIAIPLAVLASVAAGVLVYWTVEGPLHRRTSAFLRAAVAKPQRAARTPEPA